MCTPCGAGGVCAPASRALCQAKRAPRAAFPSGCLAAQTKRWAEGIRVPARLGWLGATRDWKDQVHALLEPRSLDPLRHPSASSGVVATVGHSFLRLHFHFSLSWTGEGNGSPLQCSCLENPRDGEAWWAAVYGVARSLCLTKSSACGRLWQFAHPRPLSLLSRPSRRTSG